MVSKRSKPLFALSALLLRPAFTALVALSSFAGPVWAEAPASPEQGLPIAQDAAGLFSETLAAEALAAPAAPIAAEATFATEAAPAPASIAISLPQAPAAPSASASALAAAEQLAQIERIERDLLDKVNADRAVHGLAPLLPDPEITKIARTRAEAQITAPSLTHYDANGKVAIQGLLADAKTTFSLAGENLARLRAEDVDAAQQAEVALMNSPTHRKNILEPRFNRLAVGLVRAPDGRLIFAQIFRAV